MITDCIFDFYGTLVNIHTDETKEELWLKLSEEFLAEGILEDPVQLRETYEKLVCAEEKCLAIHHPDGLGEIDLARVFAGLFPDRKLDASDPLVARVGQRFRELSLDFLYPYEGAAQMLTALRAAGKRVWLLSNAQRIFTAEEIEQVGLISCFDGIYLSSDYGVKKPSGVFFRRLLEDKSICPKQAVMIGNDGYCDIGGAEQMGIHTLYIHSETSPEGEIPDADHVMASPDMKKVQEILLHGFE